ncbi:MAG: hypothetical protein JEZ00_05045 [Anaerolineaceae bacterium]|nr:hypothetical protein [Anaerolineaceae bacterium]
MKRLSIGDGLWLVLLVGISMFFMLPKTNQVFVSLTTAHPFMMGFLKFSILATMGELLALRLANGKWKHPTGLLAKGFVWGVIGIAVTFMFSFFSCGVVAMIDKGILPAGSGSIQSLLKAFYTSLLMNLTFGPVFMAAHRISDAYIDMRAGGMKTKIVDVISAINWNDFINFVVGKTIPFWWIPVHTLTFLLPGEYRVLAAAYLSIFLGAILAYARRRDTKKH